MIFDPPHLKRRQIAWGVLASMFRFWADFRKIRRKIQGLRRAGQGFSTKSGGKSAERRALAAAPTSAVASS
jgi:hypothetical protein